MQIAAARKVNLRSTFALPVEAESSDYSSLEVTLGVDEIAKIHKLTTPHSSKHFERSRLHKTSPTPSEKAGATAYRTEL